MASPKKFTMQEVFEIAVFNISSGEIEAFLEDVKTSGIEMSAEITYAMGGRGNPYLVGYSHSRRATANVSNAVVTSEILALQSGSPVVEGINSNPYVRDTFVVTTADTATTQYTAQGDADAEIGVIYELVGGVHGERYEQAETVGAGLFTYDSGTKTITFNTGEMEVGTEIVMYYRIATDATAQTIKFDTDKFAGNKKVVFFGLATDACSKEVYEAQFIFHNAKISDNWSYDVSADGEPVVQDMSIEAVKSCGAKTLVEMVIFDKAEVA